MSGNINNSRESREHKEILAAALGILLFIILPLMAPEGYYQLGEYKSLAYLCTGAAIVMAVIFFASVGKEIKKLICLGRETGWFLFYAVSMCLSTVFSVDRKTALIGAAGWRTGLAAELISLFFCVSFIHYFRWNDKYQKLMLSGASAVILIAILNRFKVYPLSFMRAGEGFFLSTIGQVNWYCGWLSVILPFAAGMLFLETRRTQRFLLSLFCFIAFFSAISQGSDSAFLFIGTLFMILFLYSAGSRVKMRKTLQIWNLFLAACAAAAVILEAKPDLFDEYFLNHAGMAMMILHWKGVYIIFASSLAGMLWTEFMRRKDTDTESVKYQEMQEVSWKDTAVRNMILAGMILIPVSLLVVQVFFPEIFPPEFGNNRGIQWKAVSDAWRSFFAGRMLMGAGPDCLNYYLENYTAYGAQIHQFFGEKIVAAHSILLHRLFTTGILGVCAYLLLLTASLRKLLMSRTTLPFALAVICYWANGMVSFDQVMNMPYMLLLLGAGLGLADNNMHQ